MAHYCPFSFFVYRGMMYGYKILVLHHKRFLHNAVRIINYPCLLFEKQCPVIPALIRCFGSYVTGRFRLRYWQISASERAVSMFDMYFMTMRNGL